MSDFGNNPPPEDMRRFLVGFFVNELDGLLRRLTPHELQAYLLFRVEYVYAGATGLVDEDRDLARRLKCKSWAAVKAKLHTLGCIYTDAGMLRDRQFDISIERQRKTKERQRANADKRWSVAKIGGAV
jgi:uncharacterized protein YdaU (DUF1376 family)